MSDKEKGLLDRFKGLFHGDHEPPPTEEELFEIINASGETGVITDDTHEMLSSIIQLKETQVQEVMVPRTEFAAIAADRSISEELETITSKGFSRYPIFHDNLDQVIGVLYAKDILKHLDQDLSRIHPRDIMRPVHFVPETKKVQELLQEFRIKGIHIDADMDTVVTTQVFQSFASHRPHPPFVKITHGINLNPALFQPVTFCAIQIADTDHHHVFPR